MSLRLALVCALITVAALATGTAVHAATYVVTIEDGVFSPAELTVRKNDTVRWELENGFHSVTSGNPEDEPAKIGVIFDIVLDGENPVFEFKFGDTGEFAYFSRISPSAQGVITVLDATEVDRATWGFMKRLFDGPAARFKKIP